MNDIAWSFDHADAAVAAVIFDAAIAERDLRNAVSGNADRAAELAAMADCAGDLVSAERCRKLEGSLRCAAVNRAVIL